MSGHTFGRYGFAMAASGLFLIGSFAVQTAEAFQFPTFPIAISAGQAHECALISNGVVKCWGMNLKGELGVSYVNFPQSNLPVSVPLKGPAKAISSGYGFNCALLVSGEVQCWGANDQGQVGGSNSGAFPVANPVPLGGPAVAIASGFRHTCAIVQIAASTKVQCWGNNSNWQLGNGEVVGYTKIPQTVVNLSGATSIALGERHSCALTAIGAVCWGDNQGGQLGRGTFSTKELAAPVASQINFSSIAAGIASDTTCGIIGGVPYCWGRNSYGELGIGSYLNVATPTLVAGLSSATSYVGVGGGEDPFGCTIDSKQLYCSGHNSFESSVDNFDSTVPIPMQVVPSQVTAMAFTSHTGCFIVPTKVAFSSSVQCIGSGGVGELGNGSYQNSSTPVTVKL